MHDSKGKMPRPQRNNYPVDRSLILDALLGDTCAANMPIPVSLTLIHYHYNFIETFSSAAYRMVYSTPSIIPAP